MHGITLVNGMERAEAPMAQGDSNTLLDALLDEQANLARRVRDAIHAHLPAYQIVHHEDLDAEVGWVLRSVRAGHISASDRELEQLASVGETRARQRIPVADMLRAWHIGIEVVIGYARQEGLLLDLVDHKPRRRTQTATARTKIEGAPQ